MGEPLYYKNEDFVRDMDRNDVDVSVICMAYNHEKYIEKAIEGIVSQKDIKFELIIHDDASTDGTADIIRRYEKKYPEIIKAIYQAENQYSQGKNNVREYMLPLCGGRYIAICEGDDYWTDDHKLKYQTDALDKHTECDMCVCGAVEVHGDTETVIQEVRPHRKDCVLSTDEVIVGGGRYLATASYFFRRECFEHKASFEKVMEFDYTWQIKGSLRGGTYYIDRPMCVYRREVEGSWSVRVEKDEKLLKEHNSKMIKMLELVDDETDGGYSESIRQRIEAFKTYYQRLEEQREKILADVDKTMENCFLWGMGNRGEGFEQFCRAESISLRGVCDRKNDHIGEFTACGHRIYSTDEVVKGADVIFAGNHHIADDLAQTGFKGRIIDLMDYLPVP